MKRTRSNPCHGRSRRGNPYTNDASIKRIALLAFPAYKGKKFEYDVLEPGQTLDMRSCWDSGSRDYWKVVNLATNEVTPEVPAQHPYFDPDLGVGAVKIPEGFAAVCHTIFSGKDFGLTVYVNPSNVNAGLLSAPAPELTPEEKRVLYSIRSYIPKGTVRYEGYVQAGGKLNAAGYQLLKELLQTKGLLNKGFALTIAGKNAVSALRPWDMLKLDNPPNPKAPRKIWVEFTDVVGTPLESQGTGKHLFEIPEWGNFVAMIKARGKTAHLGTKIGVPEFSDMPDSIGGWEWNVTGGGCTDLEYTYPDGRFLMIADGAEMPAYLTSDIVGNITWEEGVFANFTFLPQLGIAAGIEGRESNPVTERRTWGGIGIGDGAHDIGVVVMLGNRWGFSGLSEKGQAFLENYTSEEYGNGMGLEHGTYETDAEDGRKLVEGLDKQGYRVLIDRGRMRPKRNPITPDKQGWTCDHCGEAFTRYYIPGHSEGYKTYCKRCARKLKLAKRGMREVRDPSDGSTYIAPRPNPYRGSIPVLRKDADRREKYEWVLKLLEMGLNFHPDTVPEGYVDAKGRLYFNDKQCADLNIMIDRFMENEEDPYEIGVEAFHQWYKKQGVK